MEFLRTANAGGLLKMDGASILLDGVCSKVEPYEVTPEEILEELKNNYPDAVGFTHLHPDHFLESFVCDYEKETGKKAILNETTSLTLGSVELQSFQTRHLGRAEEGLIHCSFLFAGSKRIIFTGDAAPVEIKCYTADIVIAPFAYANTSAGLKAVAATGAKDLILLHMPECEPDPYGIWESVRTAISRQDEICVHIPKIGDRIEI